MRQHKLNGWLVAALVALVCLLGVTAYAEVKEDLPRAACLHGNTGVNDAVATCENCNAAPCESITPKARADIAEA
ncbi:hypothetical protein [Mesorhizobium sp.]|uniref:hypothetical protein n=1 Tax=Mesorhizobium sp. TaxID=1871066 RepID=UPI000FE3E369|nr:hypothetical protein [Mesorhizobium sp.]RWA61580.1 MAG: hypothetical protein EOQ28_31735 [Mesorhizobium sp.]RWB94230.1 MAG: hypothetical protein EOQ57_32325 [Mesorhizobium sp.]RWG76723.1 MAG: hypothetical protein EOQ69_30935 [Mesorhizobium sp.]RWG78224.1 MAG: hypothetical protein EOQ70_31030 [Mesorhizobium sp.]RWJ98828.1 MAG: hypothetical protein EOR42_26440 [Mesorhizobium sp.]